MKNRHGRQGIAEGRARAPEARRHGRAGDRPRSGGLLEAGGSASARPRAFDPDGRRRATPSARSWAAGGLRRGDRSAFRRVEAPGKLTLAPFNLGMALALRAGMHGGRGRLPPTRGPVPRPGGARVCLAVTLPARPPPGGSEAWRNVALDPRPGPVDQGEHHPGGVPRRRGAFRDALHASPLQGGVRASAGHPGDEGDPRRQEASGRRPDALPGRRSRSTTSGPFSV